MTDDEVVDIELKSDGPIKEPGVPPYGSKSDFPDEVSEKWDDVRAGTRLAVDADGHIVDELEDATAILQANRAFAELPSDLTGMEEGDLPPVGIIGVGRPDRPLNDQDMWVNPENGRLCIVTQQKVFEVVEDDGTYDGTIIDDDPNLA